MSTRTFSRWCLVASAMLTVAGLVASAREIKPTPPTQDRESIQRYLMGSQSKAVYYLKISVEKPQLNFGEHPPIKPVDPGTHTMNAAPASDTGVRGSNAATAGASRLSLGGALVPTGGGGSIAPSRARVLSALEDVSRDLNR